MSDDNSSLSQEQSTFVRFAQKLFENTDVWLERMTKTMAHVGGRIAEAALPLTITATALGVTGITGSIMFNGGMINPVLFYSTAAAATATFFGLIYNSLKHEGNDNAL